MKDRLMLFNHYKSLSKSRLKRITELEDELINAKRTLSKGVLLVEDILPQMGRIVLQDYPLLNDFLMDAETLLKGCRDYGVIHD